MPRIYICIRAVGVSSIGCYNKRACSITRAHSWQPPSPKWRLTFFTIVQDINVWIWRDTLRLSGQDSYRGVVFICCNRHSSSHCHQNRAEYIECFWRKPGQCTLIGPCCQIFQANMTQICLFKIEHLAKNTRWLLA